MNSKSRIRATSVTKLPGMDIVDVEVVNHRMKKRPNKTPSIPGLKVSVKGLLISAATFSPCEQFRYTLHRRWSLDGDEIAFIGLNPSTADAEKDDPTIRRCIGYAKQWGFAGIWMLNLFAFRSTLPKLLYERDKTLQEIIGLENDEAIFSTCASVKQVVCCWGTHGSLQSRGDTLMQTILCHHEVHCLGANQDGSPRHLLYLRANLKPIPYHWRNR